MARPGVRVMSTRAAEARSASLDAYIARRTAQGFRVETRSGNQAVIVHRNRLYFLRRWIARGSPEQRFVLSVDQDGEVDVRAAEPLRW